MLIWGYVETVRRWAKQWRQTEGIGSCGLAGCLEVIPGEANEDLSGWDRVMGHIQGGEGCLGER